MNKNTGNIARALAHWYAEYKRDLPWRDTKDAYAIWLSEIILQQTRVDQGLPYYYRFIAQYPTVYHFAAASQDEVLKLWQGLGYYSRARNMQVAAQTVVQEYGGVFPVDYNQVRALKGVGDYTTAAILSFAYNLPYAVVDGNVMRVFSRLYAIEEPIDTALGKKLMSKLAQEHLDEAHPAQHNQAIMDFGALVCTPKAPKCDVCPLRQMCQVSDSTLALSFPVKKGKVKINSRYFNYIVARKGGAALLQRREDKDIWQGLYEFPLLETDEKLSDVDLLPHLKNLAFLPSESFQLQRISSWNKQVLSHQYIYYRFVYVELLTLDYTNDALMLIDLHDITNFAVPKPVEKEIEQILSESL